jgi:hypothetical protein
MAYREPMTLISLLLTAVLAATLCGSAAAHDTDAVSMDGKGGLEADSAMAGRHMAEMGGPMAEHMSYSAPRPHDAADDARARKIVELLRRILPRYEDYHVAEHDGFVPFHPELKQRMVHFTNYRHAIKAMFTFDPADFTSLLYEPLPGGGYKLVGVMYTAPRWASEGTLNRRIPLSVTSWHRHVNLCLPPRHFDAAKVDWKRFGGQGTITTKAECKADGGRFFPQLFGWMVHVYPMERSQSEIWAH